MRATMRHKRGRWEEEQRHTFRARNRAQMAEKDIERDFYQSQKVCEQLDTDMVSL